MDSRIASSLPEHIIKDIELKELIHHGTYSKVVAAKWEGLLVAVKQIYDVYEKELEISEYFHLHQLSHANIVRFFGIYFPASTMKLPSLVMERLGCSLCDLLEQNVSTPTEIKLSILHQTGLGLRYLHSKVPTMIHGKLSTKKVLISKGMEAKIMYFGTLVNIEHSSMSIKKPFEMDFMAPEKFTAANKTYGKKVDIFSFGCIILHTFLSNKPSYNVGKSVIHLLTALKRNTHFTQHLDKATGDVIIGVIQNCLKHQPFGRPSVVEVCDQLETLLLKANRKGLLDNLLQAILMPKAANANYITPPSDQASSKLWMKLQLTWQQCSSLPVKCWATSVAAFDGNVYVVANHGTKLPISLFYVYDPNNNKWSLLPNPPYRGFSLVAIPGKKELLAIGGVSFHNKTSSNVFLWDELNKKWINTYPNMPTSRCYCSCISYGSTVIVVGGVTGSSSVILTLTAAVEVLHIDDRNSYWSVVQRLPTATFEAIPLIIDERLYIAVGHGEGGRSKCKIVTVSLPALLQSSSNNTEINQVWSMLPDIPNSSLSISHYQGHLIAFSGDQLIEQTDKDKFVWESASDIHLYNPDTKVWDCVGEVPYNYTSGMSAQLSKNKILFIGGLTRTHVTSNVADQLSSNKILFIGGLTGTHVTNNVADLITTCWTLTIMPKHPSIVPY